MRHTGWIILPVLLFLCTMMTSGQTAPNTSGAMRFVPVHVYLDVGSEQLAAYQFELDATTTGATIVGLEGGDHAAFADPPSYDPEALQAGRIIVAAFSLDEDLPTGRTRIATLHLMAPEGELDLPFMLTVAADAAGMRIDADLTYETGA
jgi:hypothetical protein